MYELNLKPQFLRRSRLSGKARAEVEEPLKMPEAMFSVEKTSPPLTFQSLTNPYQHLLRHRLYRRRQWRF